VLSIRFQCHGDIADLDHSIECHLAALDLRPPGHLGRANALSNFATALLARYGQLRVQKDIELALKHFKTALSVLPAGDPARPIPLMNYASALFTRFEHCGDVSDLNQSISQYRAVVDACFPDNKSTSYYNLANALLSRFNLDNDLADLDLCIEYSCAALDSLKEGHGDHPLILSGLSTALMRRFERRRDVTDLETAIKHFQSALELRPPGDRRRYLALNDVADALVMRHRQRADLFDLELAVGHYRAALKLLPLGHKDEGMLLDNLGSALFLRLTKLGNLCDLEEAIEKHSLALELHSGDPTRRVVSLEALATCLDLRFEQMGDPTDLSTAIKFYNEALLTAPPHHSHCVAILNNMATSLETRFKLYGETTDLDRSISYAREALDLLPPGHPKRAPTYLALAGALLLRFEERGDEFDLDQAYLHCSTSLSMRSPSDPARAACDLLLARILKARHLPWEDSKDIEPIFQHLRTAKDFCTLGHLLTLGIYAELASAFYLRFLVGRRPSDLKEAFGHHELSLSFASGSSWPAFRASLQWVEDAETYGHSSAVDVYRIVMRLLNRHILAMRSPELQQCFVRKYVANLSFNAATCALRFQEPIEAVEALEGGRSILWSHFVRVTTPLDDLRFTGEHGTTLANDFERLSFQLERVPRIPSKSSKDFKVLLKEKDAILEQIRRIEGFKSFLKPPPFSELAEAAIEGPVIIVNASQYACDAVIVMHTVLPIHVALPQITLGDVSRMVTRVQELTRDVTSCDDEQEALLKDFLSDLWDEVVYPIVQHLITRVTRGSRLWWCPTGKFASIPLHAAGPYRTDEPSLSQVYVSSYTPTLQSLVRARSSATPSQSHRTSIVPNLFKTKRSKAPSLSAPTAPTIIAIGHPVSDETCHHLDILRNRLPPSVPFRRVEGDEVTTAFVLGAFRERSWLHLACPASLDYTWPFKSSFTTPEGDVKICDIAKARPQADFAFVSSRTNRENATTPDEAMHLASSLQYSGVRSVVGTLWPVDEEVMRRVVSAFYEGIVPKAGGLMHHTNAARSLNEALKMVESRVPLAQRIAFIHVGV
jgi:tetratricopeptide (TPR) repeat protein